MMANIYCITVISFIRNDDAAEVFSLFDAIYRSEYEKIFIAELQPQNGIQGLSFSYHHARYLTPRIYRSLSRSSQAMILLTNEETHKEGAEIQRCIMSHNCNVSVLVHTLLDSTSSNANDSHMTYPGSPLLYKLDGQTTTTAFASADPDMERHESDDNSFSEWRCSEHAIMSSRDCPENSPNDNQTCSYCRFEKVIVNMKASTENMIHRFETLSEETNKTFQKIRSKSFGESSKLAQNMKMLHNLRNTLRNLTCQHGTDDQNGNQTQRHLDNRVNHLDNNNTGSDPQRDDDVTRESFSPTWSQLQSFDAIMEQIEDEQRVRRATMTMRRSSSGMTVGIQSCLGELLRHIRISTARKSTPSTRHSSAPAVIKYRKKRRFTIPLF